jgi:mannosyltransferase
MTLRRTLSATEFHDTGLLFGVAKNDQREKSELAVPVVASLFVLVFALVRGAKDSMWYDEAFSFDVAKRSLGSLVDFVLTGEPNMGPYYLTLWGWIRIGDGDLWVRLLSALFTVAALWAVWLIVRRWSGPGPAGLAAVVLVLTPFVLAWSMQARGYTMAMAFTAWSLVFADGIRTGEGRRSEVLFGVMVGLGVASQFATSFVFVGVVVALVALAPTKATMRSLVISGSAALFVFAPFSIAAILKPDHASWIPALTMKRFFEEFDTASSGIVWAAVLGSGIVCLLVASVRSVRVRPFLMPLAGAASGLLGLVAFSILVRPLFVDRYLIGCLPLVVVAAAGGWSVLWSRWRVTLMAVVIGLVVLNFGASIERTRPELEDYRSVASEYMASAQPGDAVVAYPGRSVVGLTRYLPRDSPTFQLVVFKQQSGSWTIVDSTGAEVRPRRLWIVIRGEALPPGLRDWVSNNYPVVVAESAFVGAAGYQLRASDAQ